MLTKPIRVLIVDDSALVRRILSDTLAREPGIEVVGTAGDPYIARDKIKQLNPDVITLDIEMPRMDGLTFLKIIMHQRPTPVIMVSSLTQEGSLAVLDALHAGAVDVIAKPSGSFSAPQEGHILAEKIRAAAHAKVKIRPTPALGQTASLRSFDTPKTPPSPDPAPGVHQSLTRSNLPPSPASHPETARRYSPRQIVLLGASTGGTEALKTVLTSLPGDVPGICIVQHIPAYFSLAFANRLNDLCRFEVREAKSGDCLQPGLALVAPGGFHLVLRWVVNHYVVDLNVGPMVHHQRPAVDVLFDSAAKAGAGPHALALLLTGMGADGAAGLLKLRQTGACTIAQNEDSCVVFGMPREAIRMGAAQEILPLDHMAPRINRFASLAALPAH